MEIELCRKIGLHGETNTNFVHNVVMSELTLRPMTSNEFVTFRTREIRDHAMEQVHAGYWTEEEAEARSEKQIDLLLPQGFDTPEILLLIAENLDGNAIGHVWVALQPKPGSETRAWIYGIQIESEQRGNGYGRSLLLAAEQEIVRRGLGVIGLNVFGSNTIARNLYESAGYQVTSMHMQKELPS